MDQFQHSGVGASDSIILAAFSEVIAVVSPILVDRLGLVYGSWAIRLQSDSFPRLPQDLDLELPGSSDDVADAINLMSSKTNLSVLRHEPMSFSDHSVRSPHVWRVLVRVGSDAGLGETVLLGLKLVPEPSSPRCSAQFVSHGQSAQVPVKPLEICIAQKVARLSTRRSGSRVHTRWRDAMDLYDLLSSPRDRADSSALSSAIAQEWRTRGNTGAPRLLPAPAEWRDYWDSACFYEGRPRPSPQAAVNSVNVTLAELLSGGPSAS